MAKQQYLQTVLRGACLLAVCAVVTACNNGNSTTPEGNVTNQATEAQWLAAWGTTRETSNSFSLPIGETTVRNIVRVTAGGSTLRLRFFNLNSEQAVTIGSASVGIRQPGSRATLVAGSNQPVTFDGGQTSAVLPPNTESYYSDPIELTVANQDDLAVSLYIVGEDNPLEFGTAWNESYKLPNQSGDHTMDEGDAGYGLIDGNPFQFPAGTPVRCNGCRTYVLRDVEVLTAEANGVMVFLGSSSFHGANTSQNGFKRISDLISVRILDEIPAGRRHTVVNRAISGDTLEAAYRDRMDIDIWNTVGLTSIVVWVTNDLADRSADQIIETYQQLIADAHSRNIKVYCLTWLPGALSLQASINGERSKLNDWILNSGECDGIADYNATVEAPGGLTFLPQYNGGDFVHSNDAGHAAWAEVTPISDWVQRTD